jgi:hypothetical protein
LKKPKTERDYGISLTNKQGFVASLYAAILRLRNGGMMIHKPFAENPIRNVRFLVQNK